LDSQTGLEWLDLTATGNRSFSEVLGGYGSFTTAHGFRPATREDVATLFQHVGSVNGFGTPASIPGASRLLLTLGVIEQSHAEDFAHYYSHGMFELDQLGIGFPRVAVINLVFKAGVAISGQTDSVNQGGTCPTCTTSYVGTFLIREAASPFPPSSIQPPDVFPPPRIPEASSGSLLFLGLLFALAVWANRHATQRS